LVRLAVPALALAALLVAIRPSALPLVEVPRASAAFAATRAATV